MTTVVGLLSGTSVDAIDAAAAELHLDGPTVTLRPLGHREYPWPPGLRERILAVLPPATTTAGEVCALDNDIGRAFARAAVLAVADLAGGRADLVATLGQTVFHDVREGPEGKAQCRGTLQLGQPAWIAEATGLPVVSDLRSRDVAAGGHGAPLASTLDALLLAGDAPGAAGTGPEVGAGTGAEVGAEVGPGIGPDAGAVPRGPRAALNLGGIANVTVVGPDGVLAFDTGPANCLLDLAAGRISGGARRYDTGGALAAAGTVREDLLAVLAGHPYFAAPAPKSCGRELFGATYLDTALAGVPAAEPADLMATLTELTARTVAEALEPYGLTELVVSGGGLRNPTLVHALRRRLPAPAWRTSDELGLPADAKEAYLVALLGALTWHGLPGTVPAARAAGSRTGDRTNDRTGDRTNDRTGDRTNVHTGDRSRGRTNGRTVTGARHPTVLGRITPATSGPLLPVTEIAQLVIRNVIANGR